MISHRAAALVALSFVSLVAASPAVFAQPLPRVAFEENFDETDG